jgi:hypothetical protein
MRKYLTDYVIAQLSFFATDYSDFHRIYFINLICESVATIFLNVLADNFEEINALSSYEIIQ